MGLDDQDKNTGPKQPTIHSQLVGDIPLSPGRDGEKGRGPSTPEELGKLRSSVERALNRPEGIPVRREDLPAGSRIDKDPNGNLFLVVPLPVRVEGDVEIGVSLSAPKNKPFLPGQEQKKGWGTDQTIILNVRFPINDKGTSIMSTTALPGERLYEARPDAGMFLAGVSQSIPASVNILPGKATVAVELGATVLPDAAHMQALIFASQELIKDRNKVTTFVFHGLVNSYNVWDYTTVASGKVAIAGGYHSRRGAGARVRFFPRDDHTMEVSFFRDGLEFGYSYDFHH